MFVQLNFGGRQLVSRDAFPYCIPDRRELSPEEVQLLRHLATDSCEIANFADKLKVVARCGCGECPTILFGLSLNDEPITSKVSKPVAHWEGRGANGSLIGIGLLAADGRPTELEAWSQNGEEVKEWPPVSAIRHCAN
jgi:hypothetical protein